MCGVVLQAPWQSENSAAGSFFKQPMGPGNPWETMTVDWKWSKHLHRMFHILHSLDVDDVSSDRAVISS